MVDAFHYALWAIEHPEASCADAPPPRAIEMKYDFTGDLGFGSDNRRREQGEGIERRTERVG